MQLGRNIINFLIILAVVVVGLSLSLLYVHTLESIQAMQKDPKVIEIDSLRRKHFNLK